MPVNALADVEDIGPAVRGNVPAFSQMPFEDLCGLVPSTEVFYLPVYSPVRDA